MIVITILAAVLAITATVLALIFIAPEKKRERLNGFGKFIHDTINFKYLIVEKILQVLYILCTAYVIMLGFFMLFYVQPGYNYGWGYSRPSQWYGGFGLVLMIVGPIAVRLAYEGLMMAFLLVKNVIQINSKLKANGEEMPDNKFRGNEYFTRRPAPQYAPPAAPYGNAPQANAEQGNADANPAAVCPRCGAKVDGPFCGVCGTRFQ